MRRLAISLGVVLVLAACGGNGRSNASFAPAGDTIQLSDPASQRAAKASTLAQAQAQCAARGKYASYVASQANLGANANEHLYLCY